MDIFLIKRAEDYFAPADLQSAERMRKIKVGHSVKCSITQSRNYNFLKKFMTMIQVGFDSFEPAVTEYKGHPVQKNFDRFRKDIIIAAGFYDYEVALNGTVKAVAHSISFAKMDEETFTQVYNACCNAILQRVLTNYEREDLDYVVEQLLRY